MFWRIERGERYEDVKGASAKRRFKALVLEGRAHGVLAFAADEPVGWCAFERRVELPRLDRAPSLRVTDAHAVWSLPCFFIKAGFRRRGVAKALLAAAERALRERGVRLIEAYPSKPSAGGKMPASSAYTGLPSMFEARGFELAEARPQGRQRYRKKLRGRSPSD
jgi:GNAT superfamily N-acetyltransferase